MGYMRACVCACTYAYTRPAPPPAPPRCWCSPLLFLPVSLITPIQRLPSPLYRTVVLNPEHFCPLGDPWQCLETFLVATPRVSGATGLWQVEPGCCCTVYNLQGSPPQPPAAPHSME